MGNSTKFHGLFDLRDDGMIVYSRALDSNAAIRGDLVGQNFFDKFDGTGESVDFRLQFYEFVKSRRGVESIVLDSTQGNARLKNKVLITRAYENDDHSPHERFMLEILEDV